jgi:hypothetical protein
MMSFTPNKYLKNFQREELIPILIFQAVTRKVDQVQS